MRNFLKAIILILPLALFASVPLALVPQEATAFKAVKGIEMEMEAETVGSCTCMCRQGPNQPWQSATFINDHSQAECQNTHAQYCIMCVWTSN